jgi:signal transduction histidine kinase
MVWEQQWGPMNRSRKDKLVGRKRDAFPGSPPHGHGELVWLFFPHPVIVTDLADIVLSANPAARSLIGPITDQSIWDTLEALDQPPPAAVPSNGDCPSSWQGIAELPCEESGGIRRRFHATMQPVAQTGLRRVARLWIFRDVTESAPRRLSDDQRMKLRERSDMAAEIAHDLNNFLAVISGNAELLPMFLGDDLPENVTRCLANIQKTTEQLTSFTDSCLRLRRAGGTPGQLDLNQFLDDQITFLRPQKLFRKVVITTRWSENLPPVRCAPEDLQQIFCTLMSNAADAVHDGGEDNYTLTVRTERCPETDDRICFSVADDGPGVAASVRDQIFHARLTTKPDCEGVELFNAARTVERLGGSIAFCNRPTGGTEFTVRLPVVSVASCKPVSS